MKSAVRNTLLSLTICVLCIVGFGQACGPAFKVMTANEMTSSSSTSYLNDDERKSCALSGPIEKIDSISTLVAYINLLPRPVQLHCLIAGLPRPLHVQAGESTSSAQPSPTTRDPRILIKIGTMILSVIPEGLAQNTLEYSQLESGGQWERAEFKFPIAETVISERAGLDHIRFGNGTTCGLCHVGEAASRAIDGSTVFKSDLMKFSQSQNVSIDVLRKEADLCRSQLDTSDRCRLFRALFDLGDVLPTEI